MGENPMQPKPRPTGTPIAAWNTTITVSTNGPRLVLITDEVRSVVRSAGIVSGLCTLFIQHTSASLLIQENADPTVRSDLERFLRRLAPENDDYEHDAEGPDDMPAHIKAAVLPTSLTIPIVNGELALGTWQGLYVCEHRSRPHQRRVVISLLGSTMSA